MSTQDDTASNLPKTHFMALVMKARDGEALTLTEVPGCPEPVAVAGHATTAPWLEEGDDVLVAPTQLGAIVLDRLRQEGEPPRSDGELLLN